MQDLTPEQVLENQVKDLTAKYDTLNAELKQERDLRGKAEQELADANNLIDDLNKQLNQQTSGQAEHVVTLGSGDTAKQYRITAPKFNIPELGIISREDVKSNSDVLRKLVELQASVLEEVEQPAA